MNPLARQILTDEALERFDFRLRETEAVPVLCIGVSTKEGQSGDWTICCPAQWQNENVLHVLQSLADMIQKGKMIFSKG